MERALDRNWGACVVSRKKLGVPCKRFLACGERKEKLLPEVAVGSINLAVIIGCVALLLIGSYLFQVNSIATKGFDIKEAETRIRQLEEERQRLKIREVELKSMYNIEKSSENLELIGSGEVSYIEIQSPVAMR